MGATQGRHRAGMMLHSGLQTRACWLLAGALLLGACSDKNSLTRLSGNDEFQQAPDNSVDILWVIDNSVSMQNEQESVANSAADFIVNLEEGNMDFHLGVITTDVDDVNANAGILLGNPPVLTSACRDDGDTSDCTYDEAFQARVIQGTNGSDQERGLEAALTALEPPLSATRNAGFLREEAALSIIIVSDENDCSDFGALGADASGEECYTRIEELVSPNDLATRFKALKADPSKVRLSGIVGPEVLSSCEQTYPGTRYYTAISLLGGVQADICQSDYSAVMDQLGLIAAGIQNVFQLSHAAVPETIVVTVTPPDGAATDVPGNADNGWIYLEDYAQIQFTGTAVPARGANVLIEYEIAGPVPEPPSDTGSATTP